MISYTIDVSEYIPGHPEISNLEVHFIPSWDSKYLLRVCENKMITGNTPMSAMIRSLVKMDGPALALNQGVNHPPVIIFDYNRMTMGDLNFQINMFFDYIAECTGDIKGLTNRIYDLYLKIVEGMITELKPRNNE